MKQALVRCSVILLAILGLAACGAETQGPMTWLDRPLDGDKFSLEPLTIQAHASDADGVTRIEFFVGYNLLATVPGSGTRFSEAKAGWTPAVPGTYTIRARAVDIQGHVGPDAIAQITVGDVTPTSTVTVTPSPTLTLTPTPTIPPPPPATSGAQITFIADRYSLNPGECTTLRWNVQGGFGVQLDEVRVERESQTQVCPPQTTTYRLGVDEGEQMRFAQLVISVEVPGQPQPQPQPPVQPPPPPPSGVCPGPPVIASFTASPGTITAGQSSTLNWGKVDNATSASIDPGVGGVGTPGSTTVSPPTTTTYTLTATGCGGTTRKTVTVTVTPTQPLPIATLIIPLPVDTTPPTISNPSVNPASISKQGCGATTKTTVSATVTDAGGVNRVVARLSGIGSGDVTMNPVGGNVYRADVGSFNALGQLTIHVVAWDKAGNTAQSGPMNVSVVCIQ